MTTPILGIDEISESQAQPSVTANEGTRTLEFFAIGVVKSIGDTTPPGSPAAGDGYILGAGPSGDWSTFSEHDVVYYRSGSWVNFTPAEGWQFSVSDENIDYEFSGTSWVRGRRIMALPNSGELTIAAGVIACTGSRHTVDTESDAAADDLTTINGTVDGQIVVLSAADSGRTVVCKDATGNLKLAGDFNLDNTEDRITLISDGTNLFELSRSDNGA